MLPISERSPSVAKSPMVKRAVRTVKKSARKAVTSTRRKISSGSSSRNSSSSSSRRSSSSSRSSSGNSSRRVAPRRTTSNRSSTPKRAATPVVRPKPAPKPPSLASYLGTDSVYQQSVRGGKRSLADYLSELGRRRGEAGTQFNQTRQSMERDRTQQLEDLRQEFASRGLIQSGLYGQEQGRFQQQFTEQGNALQQQQTSLLSDLLGQEKNYRRESDLSLEQAKQEAILRRAQKYKLG